VNSTVYEQLKVATAKYASNSFLHIPIHATKSYCDSAINYTYQEFSIAVEEVRTIYQQAGYGAGHRIALVLENRAEFFIHFFALNGLGVCAVPVNADFVRDEMTYLLDDSDVSLIVILNKYQAKVEEAEASIDREISIVCIDGLQELPVPPVVDESKITKGIKADATVLYTSGTTGKPKGCVISNEFFYCVGEWYLGIGGYCKIDPGVDRLITPLPVFHTNALVWSMMAMLMSGGCVIQLDRFHSSTWWDSVRDSEATILHFLGVMPAMLLNLPETENDLHEQIKFGLGAGVEPDSHAHFEKRFGFPLIEGWAMTETGSGFCFMSHEGPRHIGSRCMGKATDEMEYRIVDENNHDVTQGELLVRRKGDDPAYGFFTEYYKNPQATEEAWKGGWFHSGDVVREGEDGSVYFVERKKNIIRRSGENIAAAEVESVLMTSPLIDNCAVAPVPDSIREEEVAACIVLNSDRSASKEIAEELLRHCFEKLSYYKAPGYIIFVDALPVTSTQKVQRGELRKLCLKLINSEQSVDCRHLKKKPS